MNQDDFINGVLFEFLGSAFMWFNVWCIYRDKQVKGSAWYSVGFWTVWGLWNLYFYPSLNLWLSFFGGLSVVAANGTWLILFYVYWRRNDHSR